MAEEFQDGDPFKAFGGKIVETPKSEPATSEDPFAQFGGGVVKKKVTGSAGVNTSKPSEIGGLRDLRSLTNTSDYDKLKQFANPLDYNNLTQKSQLTPIIDPHYKAIVKAQQIQQAGTQVNNPVQPNISPLNKDQGVIDKISQALYLPALNQGFNDLVVKPAAGATDFIDRTIDKVYQGITGEKTPEWLRKGGAFDKVANYYDKAYQERDKPTNIASETAEGVIGAVPLMASMFTGQGEATLATKAPQLVSNLTKMLATTKAATAFKDATDSNQDYVSSLNEAAKGGGKGALEGLTMEAQMLVGGALGKGVANQLAEKGLLKGGKIAEKVLHALSVGTVFGGTSAGNDVINGNDIDTHEALKQFGTGLAFELIPTAKAIGDEVGAKIQDNKMNKQALQVGAVSNAVSNLHAESVVRTLANTPVDQILAINENIKDGHEDLYTQSLESGVKAIDAKSPEEKKAFLSDQLLLKTQGDVKFLANKVEKSPDEIIKSIRDNDELSYDEQKDLIDKVTKLSTQEKLSNAKTIDEALDAHPEIKSQRDYWKGVLDDPNSYGFQKDIAKEGLENPIKIYQDDVTYNTKKLEENKGLEDEQMWQDRLDSSVDNLNKVQQIFDDPKFSSKENKVQQEVPTDEQRVAQNSETDAKVKAFQEKFPDRQVDPLEDLPESVVRTFDRVDSDLPTDPVAINEASDWLYKKYKQLTAMKNSDTRLLTTDQIEAMQEQLGEDITLLENHKAKYHGDNEQVPAGEPIQQGQPEATEQIQPAEPAVTSSDESSGSIEQPNQNEVIQPIANEQTTEAPNAELPTTEKPQSAATAPENSSTNSEADTGQAAEEQVKEKKKKTAEAIKNENTKVKAGEAGIELEDHVGEKRGREGVDADAKKAIKDGFDSHELVRKILEDGHIPTDTEDAILAKHIETVEKNYQTLNKRLEEEGASTSKRDFDSLTAEQDIAAQDYQDALNAAVKAGTAQARALGARRFNVKNDYSLGQMIKNKRAALGGEKLSSDQLKEVTKRFEEIEAANKKLQQRIEKVESDNERLKAEKTIKRIQEGEARLKRKSVTKEALADDRKKIAEEFSAKLKAMRQSGALNSVGKATVEFLQAAAPYVAKMVRNLTLEGVVELKDVVARVKEELDLGDLTDREVTDLIAGNYNEPKPTKKALTEQIADLKMQAKLIGQIEDAENGLKKAKGTKSESKASDKVKELQVRLKELTKEPEKPKPTPATPEETSLKQAKTATQNRIADLERRIRENDFSKPEGKVVPDQELLNLRRQADRLKQDYQIQLAKDELANRSKIEKLKDNFLNVASLPRALKASLDFSAVLRQGLFASAGHPKEALTAFKEMFKQTVSEEKYRNWISDLKHHPIYELMQKSDLYLSDKSDPKLLAREEEFTSNLADKIPGIGKLIAASERAYTGYLNVLRAGVFTSEAQNLIRKGYTFENNPEQFKSLAKVVNVLTGRGDIPEFLGGKQPKLLSSALFSPRFMAARIQTLYLWADPRLSREAKVLAAKDIGSTLAAGATIISLAALAGFKVQLDPRSSNFLKIQDKQEHGTTYYDILGGLPQYVRFLAQQITGQKKPANDSGMITMGSKKYGSPTRLSEAARFIRGKFSPVVGSATNLMEGKDVVGQPYHFWPNVPQEFVPLPFSDVYDAYKVGGITGGLKTFLPSQFGIGVSSYDPNAKKSKK